MFKIILIIALLLAAIIIGGGSYYYFEIYQPRVYAAEILSLYKNLENAGLEPDASSLQDTADYESALKVLRSRIAMLESIKRGVLEIKTPKRMVNFREEFTSYVDFTAPRHAHAEKLGLFIKTANELKGLIDDIFHGASSSEPGKIITIGDLQKFWGERVPKAQELGSALFRNELPELKDPSFPELKSLWEEGSPAFDLVFGKIQSLNPKLSVGQAGTQFASSEMKRLETQTKKLEEFGKKLEALVKKYSAYNLLAFRYFPDASSTESSERALRFYQAVQKLKEMY